jgi:hypothetical protein
VFFHTASRVCREPRRHGVGFEGFDRGGVQRGGAAERRGDYDFAVWGEDFVGVGHFGLWRRGGGGELVSALGYAYVC